MVAEKPRWQEALEAKLARLEDEGRRLHQIAPSTGAGEAMLTVVRELRDTVVSVAQQTDEWTVAEFAQEHGVTEQTVRIWCGLWAADGNPCVRRVGVEWRIRAGTVPPVRRLRRTG